MNHFVTIGEIKVTKCPGKLTILGLGSCVGVCLYDPVEKIGGMAHVMLPNSSQFSNIPKPSKFADLAIPMLVEKLLSFGAQRSRLIGKLAGGAQMFSASDNSIIMDIGERNTVMVKHTLEGLKIRVAAEDLGGNKGRTMILETNNCSVTIKKIGEELRKL